MLNWFSNKHKQKRLEKKINKYRNAFQSDKIKELIDVMPKNEATLEVIETKLNKVIDGIEGRTTNEKWAKLKGGMMYLTDLLKKNKEVNKTKKVEDE